MPEGQLEPLNVPFQVALDRVERTIGCPHLLKMDSSNFCILQLANTLKMSLMPSLLGVKALGMKTLHSLGSMAHSRMVIERLTVSMKKQGVLIGLLGSMGPEQLICTMQRTLYVPGLLNKCVGDDNVEVLLFPLLGSSKFHPMIFSIR